MMEERKKRTIVLSLNAYAPPDPSEVTGRNFKWVKYGDDNLFLNYLTERYYGSPTNNATIKGIAQMVVGDGLTSILATKRPDDYAKAMVIFPKKDVRRWAFDLKCYGYFIMQVIPSKSGGYVAKYTPVDHWRSGIADANGKVNEWYFSDDWSRISDSRYKPIPYPTYKKGTTEKVSILPVLPFTTGSFYYSAIDYMGCLAYAHLEEEVGTFHLNNVLNGMQPGMMINFNNGIPEEEERQAIENRIVEKWTGSGNAGRFILAFNDSKDQAATIEASPINDLDKQFQFVSTESTNKVLLGHRVTSPLLFGIRAEGGGLGNNANELTEAYRLFDATVLEEYRAIMTDAFEALLNDQGISIPLTFIPNRFFTSQSSSVQQQHLHQHEDMSDQDEKEWLAWLDSKAEILSEDEWQLVLEEPIDSQGMSLETELGRLDGRPQAKSLQDRGLYKVRYAYSPEATQGNSRSFCISMVERAKKGMVYRKEDILVMGELGVNGQFAPRGESTYSIWLYKGGVNCHHFWMRRIYMRKRGSGGKFLPKSQTSDLENENPVSVNKAKKDIDIPVNSPKVATRPIDMPNQGRKN